MVNPRQAWFRELSRYLGNITWEEYIEWYIFERVWFNDMVRDDPAGAFELNWCLLRQPFRHRWTRWDHVVAHMPQEAGALLDYGCGTGEMLAWLRQRRPHWIYDGHDLDSPHYAYAKYRGFAPLKDWHIQRYDVVTCHETLEHVPNPVQAVEEMRAVLKPGSVLLWDFIDDHEGGNVATREARREVLRMLKGTTGQREVYVK